MGIKPVIKVASDAWEINAIHSLNYRTFVEEIPQHEENQSRMLIDKFHSENTYLICVCGKELLGMVALRGSRPFSLDYKLDDLDKYLPEHKSICEIRLLAIEKQYRKSSVFTNLLRSVLEYAVESGYEMGVISGTTRQMKLYKHLGMKKFGPLVGTSNALYQPMYITIRGVLELMDKTRALDPKTS